LLALLGGADRLSNAYLFSRPSLEDVWGKVDYSLPSIPQRLRFGKVELLW
jgi:hypothetical protein